MIFLILAGVIFRLLPHAPNVAPIGALALFAGATLSIEYALITLFGTLLITDTFLGYHPTMIWVYASYLLILGLAQILRNQRHWKRIAVMSLSSSLLFFIVTNFGVWVSTQMYTKDLNGLLTCYVMAIPFFRNTVIGDALYSGIFFGGLSFLSSKTFSAYDNTHGSRAH